MDVSRSGHRNTSRFWDGNKRKELVMIMHRYVCGYCKHEVHVQQMQRGGEFLCPCCNHIMYYRGDVDED